MRMMSDNQIRAAINRQMGKECLIIFRIIAAFGAPMRQGGSTVRTVYQAGWHVEPGDLTGGRLRFEITADAFLYHMVRRLVHVLVETGQGRLTAEQVKELLERPPQHPVQGLAPAHGLVLAEVYYRPPGAGEDWTL